MVVAAVNENRGPWSKRRPLPPATRIRLPWTGEKRWGPAESAASKKIWNVATNEKEEKRGGVCIEDVRLQVL